MRIAYQSPANTSTRSSSFPQSAAPRSTPPTCGSLKERSSIDFLPPSGCLLLQPPRRHQVLVLVGLRAGVRFRHRLIRPVGRVWRVVRLRWSARNLWRRRRGVRPESGEEEALRISIQKHVRAKEQVVGLRWDLWRRQRGVQPVQKHEASPTSEMNESGVKQQEEWVCRAAPAAPGSPTALA